LHATVIQGERGYPERLFPRRNASTPPEFRFAALLLRAA